MRYLPHYAVYQGCPGKAKCRVVFDGSAEINGASLHRCLEPGLKLQPDLVAILLRFCQMADSESKIRETAESILRDSIAKAKMISKDGKIDWDDVINAMTTPPNEEMIFAPKPSDNANNEKYFQNVAEELQKVDWKLRELLKRKHE
ncbi:hypothetical protein T09_15251 [Trichinella sp. T9]|nr:hypothetical protein T09_15251 [Trichinella sp. T9]